MEHITGRPSDCGVFPRPGDKSVAYVSSANEPLLQTDGTSEAAVAVRVGGHLVIRVAERGTAAGRLDGSAIGIQHRAADGHARGTAVALVRLNASRTIRGRDHAHDAHGRITRNAGRVDAVAGVDARGAVGGSRGTLCGNDAGA
jgi:hypothetical protein